MTEAIDMNAIGADMEARLVDELKATPAAGFENVKDLRNLAGESTGYVNVYHADKLVKASYLSISVGPGRYFNLHVIPEPQYDIPRFVYEGMVMPGSSQVSVDMFPDMDMESEVLQLVDMFGEAAEIFDKARNDSRIRLEPSRFLHMRALSSPLFLLILKAPDEALPVFDAYAQSYLDAWLKLYRNADEISSAAAATRAARREHMVQTLIQLDPDRDMVVKVYGEETTQAIEAASML